MKEPDVKQPTVHVLAGRGGKPWIPASAGMTSLLFAGMTSLLFGGTTSLFFAATTSLFRHARGGGHPGLPKFDASRGARSAMDH